MAGVKGQIVEGGLGERGYIFATYYLTYILVYGISQFINHSSVYVDLCLVGIGY